MRQGDISKGEFVQHVRRLGVSAQKKDIEALFRELDTQGSGELGRNRRRASNHGRL